MPIKLRNLFNEDLDVVFAYRTELFATIQNSWLGFLFRVICGAIILYAIGVVKPFP